MRVLTQNFNTLDLVKFVKKIKKLHIQIVRWHHEEPWAKQKSERPRFYGQNKLFFCTMPFSPWVFSTTWLLIEAPHKYKKNEYKTHFEQKLTTGSYRVGIWHAWCSQKACEICSSIIQKKKLKKKYFSSYKLPKLQLTNFWSQGILGVTNLYGKSNILLLF
jgi:hypothetical protein